MAGEIQLNGLSLATESGGSISWGSKVPSGTVIKDFLLVYSKALMVHLFLRLQHSIMTQVVQQTKVQIRLCHCFIQVNLEID